MRKREGHHEKEDLQKLSFFLISCFLLLLCSASMTGVSILGHWEAAKQNFQKSEIVRVVPETPMENIGRNVFGSSLNVCLIRSVPVRTHSDLELPEIEDFLERGDLTRDSVG
jgi:hypothetical protein